MAPLIALLLVTTSPPEPPPEPPPRRAGAVGLAIEVAEAAGATTRTLSVAADPSLSRQEVAEIEEALLKTGLFRVRPDGIVALTVRRMGDTVLAVLERRGEGEPERVWVGSVEWPRPATAPPAPREAQRELEQKLQDYHRQSLEMRWLLVGGLTPQFPSALTRVDSQRLRDPESVVHYGGGWDDLAGAAPITTARWAIVRGGTEAIDELDLARLLEDQALRLQIEDARSERRLTWGLGFGGAAVTGVAAGAALIATTREDQQSLQTFGVSLIVLGVVTGAVAALFPLIGDEPVLSALETRDSVDAYNRRLRARLGLRPSDLVAETE